MSGFFLFGNIISLLENRADRITFCDEYKKRCCMDVPLELAFHNMTPSDGLSGVVRQQVTRLEKFYGHIIGCRVVIEMPHKRHRQGQNAPDVHVLLRVPGREIVVTREQTQAGNGKSTDNAYAMVRDAFAAVQQRLKDYRRIQLGEVKSRELPLFE
jgi:hypothetical protein